MARPREPVDLVVLKGKKHLTKAEIEERKAKEVKAPHDKVRAPTYLPKDLRRDFKKISDELIRIEIMSNLDVDALARFLIARKMYLEITSVLLETQPLSEIVDVKKDKEGNIIETNTYTVSNGVYSDLLINQDKLFKQCRQASSDLGLTITSRCRLVVPKVVEEKPKNKFNKFM
ncbi:terminase [Bacillus thuringiensis serovar shandongiensis]|uniref:phage terminase small subunit P27 family n=1 Tax=Bacillus toyonensis TaxID=155322 RepID=UPI000B445030|nr:phage terminase small subunit P27 family [Bacillus toyonensis]MEC2390234.1 phage terminase small subunit P27 family [Bacillus toyonensis]OTX32065.1 terminase [Bacillus thuringiensis serovar malayensis]OUB10825.1 terminase [Bacillus thuringiensis serovar shandongiensis]